MFDLLKEKIAAFASKIGKKAEEKPAKPVPGQKAGAPDEREITDYYERPPARTVEEMVLPGFGEKKAGAIAEPRQAQPIGKAAVEEKFPAEEKSVVEEKPAKISALSDSISKVKEKLAKAKAEEKAAPEKPAEKKPEEKPAEMPRAVQAEKAREVFPEKPKPPEKPPEEEFSLSKISSLWKETFRPPPKTVVPEEKSGIPAEPPAPQKTTEIPKATPGIPEKDFSPKSPFKEQERIPPKKSPEDDKRELKARVGAIKTLKGVLQGYVQLGEKEINGMLFELELSLLEADVNQETASALVQKIKELLVSEKIPRGNEVSGFLQGKIKEALTELTATERVNLFELIERSRKPFKILFLGPNGAGKTTTIAKLSFALQLTGKTVIWAAGDTFRAASIEQLEEHAKKLKIRVVKHKYGADPAAVAFDAVKAAEANHIDVVMVDSAGRQETNKNLIEELKKMERVLKPDFKIFIGEAFAGKGLLEQAKAFDEALGIDGFILTKIDTDAKGGTVLSLLCELKKPVLFIGTGQGYEDLVPFTPQYIIDRIV